MEKKVLFLEGKKDQAKAISWYLKKYKKFKLDFIDELLPPSPNSYDLIIPSGADSTLKYILKYGDIHIGQLTYTKDNLIAFDKIKSIQIVKEIGVPSPITYTDKSQIKNFPVFYKSLHEQGYSKRGIIRNELDLITLVDNDVFFQEFIWSKGTYSVGFLADRGKIITTFTQKEIISYPYHGGSGVILKRIYDKRLIEYTKRIVKTFNYSGWGLTEFKYCKKRDDFVFMELNAKFWASLKFAFENNPDFLKYLFDIEINPKNIDTIIYIDRVILSDWEEILLSLPYMLKTKWVKSQSIAKVLWKRITNDREGRKTVKIMPAKPLPP